MKTLLPGHFVIIGCAGIACSKNCFSRQRRFRPVFTWLLITLLIIPFRPVYSASPENHTDREPIYFGILPHLSSNMLIKKYEPLVDYLRQSLSRPVIVNTAPNFRAYVDRVANDRYDVYLTAPHFAAFHINQNGHTKLTRFSRDLYGVIVVRSNSPIKYIYDLRGTTVATPSPIAAISMLGEVALMNSGLEINKDVQVKYTKSHTNALVSVAEGKVDAAIVGVSAYDLMSTKTKHRLRILSKTGVIPHMFFLSSNRVSKPESEKLKSALLNFAESDIGKRFFADAAFGSMIIATEQDIFKMDSMLPLLKSRLSK